MQQLQRRWRVGVAVAVVAATGAAVALTSSGTAAPQVAPTNQSPPTISGTPTVGSVLTADPGTWNGSQPITFTYQWRRCDRSGGSCSNISGANQKTYTLKSPDRNNTLRVRVAARNADGSAQATSVPTAVVGAAAPPQPATGCPGGTGTIPIAQLSQPARLTLDRLDVSPPVVGGSTQQIMVRFHVSSCKERSVDGALVYVTAVPFSQFTIPPETPTGADGWASMTMSRLGGFPAARRQQLLVLFGRARKPGEDPLGGVSTRRLVSVRVDLSR
jgi:hypothetical protein